MLVNFYAICDSDCKYIVNCPQIVRTVIWVFSALLRQKHCGVHLMKTVRA